MSFWGLSDAGSEAKGFPREYGAWNFQQYKDWLGRQNEFGQEGDKWRDWSSDYFLNRANTGFPSPTQTWETARQILPGVDDAIENQWQRWGEVGDIMQNKASGLNANYANIQDLINSGYGRGTAREDAYHGDIVSNLQDVYGGLQDDVTSGYGYLRGITGNAYTDLLEGSETTYDQALKDLEVLRPGGEAAMARTSRSFSPAMASANRRIRAAGINPNSPEAASMLGRVDLSRARAMEDAAVDQTQKYISQKTGLNLSKEDTRRALELGKLGGEVGLSREETGLLSGLKREQGGLFRDEQLRTLGAQQGMDTERTGAMVGLEDVSTQRAQDWWNQNIGNKLGMNQQELTNLNTLAGAYGLGQQQEQLNLSEQDRAAAQLMGLSDEQYRLMLQSGQQAQGFGNDALEAYMKSYGLEASNAGWGAKLLANVGMTALPYIGSLFGGGGGGGGSTADLSKYFSQFWS